MKVRLVLAGMIVILLSGCGSDSGVIANVKVTSMATRPASRASTRGAVDSTRLIPSNTAYSYAVVDGVKFHVNSLRAELASSDSYNEIALSGDITFTDSSSSQVGLSQSVTWPVGTYRGISVRMRPSWQLKGYCRTGYSGGNTGTLVYTRAGTIGTVNCSTDPGSCTTLPSDYDFHTISFLSTYPGYREEYQQETHINFTIAKGDSPVVSLLYDGSYNIACWDGSSWNDANAFAGMQVNSSATRTDYFPNGAAAFGSGYLPIFGYLTTDASEAAPSARTFLASTVSSADLAVATGANFKNKSVVTLVYKADGTIFAGSTRNYQGNDANSVFDLDLEGFTASSGGTGNDFYASGWFYDGTAAPTFVRNRKFTAFNPSTTVGTVFQADATDASQCGLTKTDFQGNNASRACHGGTQSVFWKEVTR